MILYTKKQIPFQIDDDDFAIVSWYTWTIDKNGYPVAHTYSRKDKHFIIYLHNLIMGKAGSGLEWDHIDRDKQNNKRNNLRLVSHQINMRNQKLQANNTSGVRGISWCKNRKRWRVRIGRTGKLIGYFNLLDAAITARRAAELKYWGFSVT